MSKKKNSKVIFSPQLAKYLLSRGHRIINVKQHKMYPHLTVFVFEINDDLFDAIEDWTAK